MRALILVSIITLVSLSGCSGSGGLGAYLVQPGDVPGCVYADYDSEELAFLRENFNLTGNPGSIDNEVLAGEFGGEGARAISNLVAFYECSNELESVVSVAILFDSPEATAWLEEEEMSCDDGGYEFAMANGPFLTFFEIDGDESGEATKHVAQRIAARTGMALECATI